MLSAIMVQRGVGDKAVNQLEKSVNSKLEATVARHIQAQFQTSGKQILQVCINESEMQWKAKSRLEVYDYNRTSSVIMWSWCLFGLP